MFISIRDSVNKCWFKLSNEPLCHGEVVVTGVEVQVEAGQ